MSLKPLLLMAALGGLVWVGLTVTGGGLLPQPKAVAKQDAAPAEPPGESSLVITATDAAGAANLAASEGESPFDLREQSTPGALPEIQPESVAGLSAPDLPEAAPASSGAVPFEPLPARGGPVGVLTALERQGALSGVTCDQITIPEGPDALYEVRGRGEPGALVAFLAGLEGEPLLGGPVDLRVWAQDERELSFRARWAVADPVDGER